MSLKPHYFYSLSSLINRHGEAIASKLLGSFSPFIDTSAADFLTKKAISMEKKDLSRTFLALSSDDGKILGFFTLGLKCIRIPDDSKLSKNVLKQCNIEDTTKVAQAFLLGQLARSSDSPKGFGDVLMDSAIMKLRTAKEIVGCRMLRLDCTDELLPYYLKHGFVMIRKNEDKDLNQMLLFI